MVRAAAAPVRGLTLAVIVVVLAIVAGTVGCEPQTNEGAPTAAPAEPTAAPDAWKVGVFRGSLRPDYVRAHEEWLGRPVDVVLEMIPYDSWEDIADPSQQIRTWATTPYDVVFTAPMLPSDGSTLEQGAQGAFDEHWRRFGQAFVDGGRPDALIRLGHEFNHTFYPWTASGGLEDVYARYYRRIVDVLRGVAGTELRFVWNALSGVDSADVEKAYPGDQHVDVISLDVYDSIENMPGFEDRWNEIVTQPVGLAWLEAFAGAHGKPMAFDEWALVKSTNHERRDPSGDSGDNTVFIERMLDFFDDENVLYASYFDWTTRYGWTDSRIMDGPYPNASAAYRSRVGGRPAAGTPTSSAAPAAASGPACAAGTVALIVGDAARLPAGDVPVRNRLVTLGLDVCAVDDDAVGRDRLAEVALVIVTSSVEPQKVPAWLRDHDRPLLNAETFAQATLGLAERAWDEPGTEIGIVDPAHPVAAGRSGSVAVQSAAGLGRGIAAPGAVVVAEVAGGAAAVWTVERGAALTQGVAPARRAAFFFSYESPPVLTADGWALFDAAVGWLQG